MERSPATQSRSRGRPVGATRATRVVESSLYIYALLITIGWLWAINAARYLRPSSDDYCIGVRAELGVIGGFVEDWQTWSGFAVPSFITNLVLGIPLVHAPLAVALAIPFVIAALCVACTALVLINDFFCSLGPWRRLLAGAVLAPPLMTLWWGYLWSSYSQSGESQPPSLSLGLTHWQTLNTAYVIPIALVASLGAYVLRGRASTWHATLLLSLLLGLIAGFSGPSIALAVLGLTPAVTLGLWVMRDHWWWLKGITVWLSTASMLAISLQSPGSQNRASQVRSGAETTLSSAPGWFLKVMPDGFIAWFSLYWQWGTVLVVGSVAIVVYSMRIIRPTRLPSGLGLTLLTMTMFSIALAIATKVTDELTYGAYWHESAQLTLTFLTLIVLGITVGFLVPDNRWQLGRLVAPVLILAFGVTTLANVLNMSTSITERFNSWQDGPAPIGDIVLDRESDLINSCWIKLQEIRGGA